MKAVWIPTTGSIEVVELAEPLDDDATGFLAPMVGRW
jgi:hypothetical protein